MGKLIPNRPKIFNVNWFRTDANGRFIWPGFGDNMSGKKLSADSIAKLKATIEEFKKTF